ncbi:MAG: hypothetical protein ABI988_07235 [Nitrospirota bacterium]
MNRLPELTRTFRAAWPQWDERTRRGMAATEAVREAYGGGSVLWHTCGVSRTAIRNGNRDIQRRGTPLLGRIRRPGAGRKSITPSDPRLVQTPKG